MYFRNHWDGLDAGSKLMAWQGRSWRNWYNDSIRDLCHSSLLDYDVQRPTVVGYLAVSPKKKVASIDKDSSHAYLTALFRDSTYVFRSRDMCRCIPPTKINVPTPQACKRWKARRPVLLHLLVHTLTTQKQILILILSKLGSRKSNRTWSTVLGIDR